MKSTTLLCLLFAIISCNSKSATDSVQKDDIVEIPEAFIEFYEKFHTDSIYQMNHIIFPLAETANGSKWQKENWTLHKPFNSLDGEFNRQFDNLSGIIIEIMWDKSGTVSIERRYSEMDDEYHLIFYKIDSKFGK